MFRLQLAANISHSLRLVSESILLLTLCGVMSIAMAEVGDLKWSFETGSAVNSSPAIAKDGTVYVGSDDGYLYALNADGSQKWSYETGGVIRSSPTIGPNKEIYFGSHDGRVYALNPDGSLKWSYLVGGAIQTSPAIGADGTIYVGTDEGFQAGEGHLFALNPDGTEKWFHLMPGEVRSSPAIAIDGIIYVASKQRQVDALNPDGTVKWSYTTGGGTLIYASPAIAADGTIYIGDDGGFLHALNPDGSQKWSRQVAESDITSSPVIDADGTIYVASFDGVLYGINPENGTENWSTNIPGGRVYLSSPALGRNDGGHSHPGDRGSIYIGADDGQLYAFVEGGLVPRWAYLTGGAIYSSPAIAMDGTVYIGSEDGKLYAIESEALGLVPSQWPMFGRGTDHAAAAGGGFLQWSFLAGTRITTSAAIAADGSIYFGADDGELYALNPDGSLKWFYPATSESSIKLSPSVAADGSIYFGSPELHVSALNPDGSLRWSYPLGAGVSTSPSIGMDGSVYFGTSSFGTGGNTLYALNADGSRKWLYEASAAIESSPAIGADGSVYFGSNNGIYAINPDGTLKWTLNLLTSTQSSPAIGTDGTVYIGANDRNLYALNPDDGSVKWSYSAGANILSSPAIGADGTIYFGSSDNDYRLYAVNPDGSSKWSYSLGLTVTNSSSPAVGADGTIYVGDDEGRFFAVNPDGRLKWIYHTTGAEISASPVIGENGSVYIGSDKLYAIAMDSRGAADSSWPMSGQNMRNTGSVERGLKWSFATEGGLYSSPALGVDGTVYVGSSDKHVYALNPDGSEQWSYETGGAIQSSPVVGLFGTIYVGSYDGSLYAVNSEGVLQWSSVIAGEDEIWSSSPAVAASGHLYICAKSGLSALDTSGALLWRSSTGGRCSPPAIAVDGSIYTGSLDGHLYAFNSDGSEQWAFATAGNIESSPSIGADGTIYIGSGDGNVYAVNPGGSQKWSYYAGGIILAAPTITADGVVYIVSADGRLHALNPDDGSLKWQSSVDNFPFESSLAIGADGVAYAGTRDGLFVAIKEDGSIKWSSPTPGGVMSSTVIAKDGSVYIASDNGKLYAFESKSAGLAESPWPMYQQGSGHRGVVDAFPADPNEHFDTDGDGIGNNADTDDDGDGLSDSEEGALGTDPLNADTDGDGAHDNNDTYPLDPLLAYRLTVTSPVGGTVTSNPAGIDCGSVCEVGFANNTSVVLTVEPEAGYLFSAWGGDCSSTAVTCELSMTENRTVSTSLVIADGDLKWAFSTGGEIISSAAIAPDGTVYVGSYDQRLYAVRPEGTEKWSYKTTGIIRSSPSIDIDGTIYIGSDDGHLYALNPDGSLKWSYRTGAGIRSSAAISADGTIYVGSDGGRLYALDRSGRLLWSFLTRGMIRAPAAISADGTIYVATTDGYIYALNPNGSQKWTMSSGSRIASPLAIAADGTVYFNAGRLLYAIDHKGTIKWRRDVCCNNSSAVIGEDGTLYVHGGSSSSFRLYAIFPDGRLKWTSSRVTPSADYSIDGVHGNLAAVGADGTIYYGDAGNVYAVGSSGVEKWAYSLSGATRASPVIGADGTVYMGTSDGKLYAIATDSGGLAKSPWPMFMQGATHSGYANAEADTDGDGLPDAWETYYFPNLAATDGTLDSDNDSLLDADEFNHGTNPTLIDTDGDGDSDKAEVTYGTDPLSKGDSLDDHRPVTPVIDSGSLGSALTGQVFDALAFADPDQAAGDYLTGSEWSIGLNENFTAESLILNWVVEYQSGMTEADVRQLTLPDHLLQANTQYWVKTRHKDEVGLWSDWSTTKPFTTVGVNPDDTDANGVNDRYQLTESTDTNNDGIDDSNQDIVAISNAKTSEPVGVDLNTGTLDYLSANTRSELPEDVQQDIAMPYGMFSMSISGLTTDPDNPVTIELIFYFPENLPADTKWYKYDAVKGELFDYSDHVIFNGNLATVKVTDGGLGDGDGVVNGRIIDPGGPVFGTPSDDDSKGSSGGGSVGIWFLLCLLAGIAIRRQLGGILKAT